ncbi:MAG: hypothetical protein KDC12_09915 [Flavobacteriales bacterium]|nr:hypothetical protein [Flavobacteriales bacterium]
MKLVYRAALLLFCSGTFAVANAQTNDTPEKFYLWGKKSTSLQSGYVVLKSGTKLDGKISLSGAPGHVNEITIVNSEGKEKTLPANSLDSYGLYVVEPICDTPVELFKWGMASSSTNGKGETTNKRKSKAQPGYLYSGDGTKWEGQLQIKEINGGWVEYTIENESGEHEFLIGDVGHFGLLLTMDDMGKKNGDDYNDPARNFQKGWIETEKDGRIEGFIAMVGIAKLNNNKYEGIHYAASESAIVDYYSAQSFDRAGQIIDGVETVYQPFEDGVVSLEDFLARAEGANDVTKSFQEGYVVLLGGTRVDGQIRQNKHLGSWFGNSVTILDKDELLKSYSPSQIDFFVQNFEGKEHKYIVDQGVLVELLNEGNTFWFYRNPFPTTSYKFLSDVAGALTQAAVDTLAKAAAYNAVGNAIEGKNDNLQEDIENISEAHAAGSELASAIDIKRKEYIVWNRTRNEKTIFNTKNYDEKINEVLMGCEKFIFMDKDEQKPYLKFDNAEMAFEFINECY